MRKVLVDEHKLDAVIKLPSGTFKPYTGVSTAILLFTKTSSGGTDQVWFYDVRADGLTLDDKRTPIEANDLPDVLTRWRARDAEASRSRTDQSFFVPKQEIVDNGYDLSLNRYKEIDVQEVEHRSPTEILDELDALEVEIQGGLERLREMIR